MPKGEKTHAMRALEAQGIAYRATQYDATGAFHSAEEAASLAGARLDAESKTLVVQREGQTSGRPLLVMVPASAHIDLKVLARSTGAKRLRMATQREAEQLTGMQAASPRLACAILASRS